MTPTETIPGRLWLLLPGCRIYPGDDCPDPSLAVAFCRESDAQWTPGPPSGAKEGPAKAAKRTKAGGTMFDHKKGGAA